jgi:hypothetical protein
MAKKEVTTCDVASCGKQFDAGIPSEIDVNIRGEKKDVCPKCAAKIAAMFQPKSAE